MKQITLQSFRLSVVALILLSITSCNRSVLSGSRLTPENYDQVSLGMSGAQVEKILGREP